jgi:hypothetical protein
MVLIWMVQTLLWIKNGVTFPRCVLMLRLKRVFFGGVGGETLRDGVGIYLSE